MLLSNALALCSPNEEHLVRDNRPARIDCSFNVRKARLG